MNYELAKELKDAGFPQLFDIGSLGHDGSTLYMAYNQETLSAMQEHATYYPTLSELIEACGDSFGSLERQQTNHWAAMTENVPPPSKPHVCKAVDIWCDGSTPEEAVARLWLALHST